MRLIHDIVILLALTFTAFFLGYQAHAVQTPETQIVYEYIFPQPHKTHIVPTKDENQVVVTWIKDEFTVDLALKEYEEKHGKKIAGYAEIWDGYCNIYAHDFDYLESSRGKTFLHEATHCFKGSWHE